MSALFAVVVGMGALQLQRTAHHYSQMTEHLDPPLVRLARLNKDAAQMGYDLYRSSTLTCLGADAEVCRSLRASFAASTENGAQSLAESSRLDPAHDADYRKFATRFAAAAQAAAAAMALSDQDRNVEAAQAMNAVDPQIRGLAADVRAYNDARLAETKARSVALAKEARRAVWTMLAVGFAAVLGGLAAGAWIAMTAVSRPLVRLAERMKALAGGDLAVEVEGLGRRDEIGSMAGAVQVFKENGLKLKSAEAEAARGRRETEEERRRTEAAREQAAREQAQVVEGLAAGLARLSAGDLTHALDEPFAPQYETLRRDFNQAMEQLRAAMGTIADATHTLRGGADEISSASDNMSRRTEQQTASLEESAAALDQVTATVRKSAEGARQAAAVASEARQEAVRSGEVVREAVTAMAAIEQSSAQISQIIGVIDEIAFQTNLLALNAGVEAARAGDVGRGFAVVAQEVRALAERSAEAAKEIKGLIAASSVQVERGVQLVRDTGEALRGILEKVAGMDGLVVEISTSAQEQSSSLVQVNAAVAQMDQATQQNAAMVEEAAAAATSLKAKAHELAGLISRFRTSNADADGAGGSANPVQRLQGRLAATLAPQPAIARR